MDKNLFADIPNIGQLYFYNIYLFYDEPQLFSCIDSNNHYYFVLAIPSEDDKASWLLVPVTTGRLSRLEKNTFQIRNALLKPENKIYRLDESDGLFCCNQVNPSDLTDDLLPEANTYLDYKQAQNPSLSNDNIADSAEFEMRDIIDISLEPNQTNDAEMSCFEVGNILTKIQNLFYELAGENKNNPKDEFTLCLSGMYVGSVGLRLKSKSNSNQSGETSLSPIIRKFNELLEASDDLTNLQILLQNNNSSINHKYKDFFEYLKRNKTSFVIQSSTPNKTSYLKKQFSYNSINKICKEINSVFINTPQVRVETEEVRGRLVGINIQQKRFEFIDNNGNSIKGFISQGLLNNTFSIPNNVSARMEITYKNNKPQKYTLMSI